MDKRKKPDLKNIPSRPGSYLMKDADGKILYVGKAINLRSRVRSYFRDSAKHTHRIARMVSLVKKVDFIVTDNEIEALILENILIKKEKPPYNVMLRDDKTYPYLKLTTKEKFPRLFIVRKVLNDGSAYFGPYVSAKSVRAVKQVIHKIFPIRQSKDNLDNAPPRRPCLNYQMKRCLAPCSGKISQEEYGQMLESVIAFINGKDKEVSAQLKTKMAAAAKKQEFELAALLRDQINAIERLHERQKIDSASDIIDEDYIAAICEGGVGVVRIMMVRNGKLMGDQNFVFKKTDDRRELVEAFIKQFYNSAFAVPSSLIVNVLPNDKDVVEKWLSQLRKRKAEIIRPERGRKKKMMDMVLENAKLKLLSVGSSDESIKESLREVKDIIGMDRWPAVMECVDISTIQGVSTVGSLVTFFNGEPDKSGYKRYKIKTSEPGDYAAIAEVVERRFKRILEDEGRFPDLLVIDGGAGQVSSASGVAWKYNPNQTIIGIAKGPERERSDTDQFILAGKKEPLSFPPSSAGRFLLQRLRDESHRFAINYHRKTRDKKAFKSEVEEVKGFGPKRKKALIKEFGSLKSARSAGVDEIARALSINEKLAIAILEKL